MSISTDEIIPYVTEVTIDNYWRLLPKVLLEISEATFVSIDLEMSGVSIKQQTPASPKPTLEEAYRRIREAAHTYQILQVGITCARLQPDGVMVNGESRLSYFTHTFSFQLTPTFPTANGYDQNAVKFDKSIAQTVDRKIAFSLNSLSFLEENTEFKWNNCFDKGIPYLSRLEITEVRTQHCNPKHFQFRVQKDGGIKIKEQSPEAQKFYEHHRDIILTWAKEGGSYLNIENPFGGRLNKLQIAILNRIVHNELLNFNLRGTIRYNLFYQVEKVNQDREHEGWVRELATRTSVIRRHNGFRLVIEALLSNQEISGFTGDMDTSLCELMAGSRDPDKMQGVRNVIDRAEAALEERKPIIVAHNALADVCFLYHTFIGPLPADLDMFRNEIAVNFGKLVDTKYLSTRGHHDMMPDKNLGEMYEELRNVGGPRIVPARTRKLGPKEKAPAHEAGYDSFMTAVVFGKLCFVQAGNPEVLRHLPREDGPPFSYRARALGGCSFGRAELDEGRIPNWDCELFKCCFGNKTRVGTSGVLRFYRARK